MAAARSFVASVRWQRTRWSSATSTGPGMSARHTSAASTQRGAKAQPGGRLARSGGLPGIAGNLRPDSRRHGRVSTKPDGVGVAWRADHVAHGTVSMIRPAYMTAMRSATSTATAMSWVTKIIDRAKLALQFAQQQAGSALGPWHQVRWSARRPAGFCGWLDNARAIMARCRMPPDISCGISIESALGARDAHARRAAPAHARAPPLSTSARACRIASMIWLAN